MKNNALLLSILTFIFFACENNRHNQENAQQTDVLNKNKTIDVKNISSSQPPVSIKDSSSSEVVNSKEIIIDKKLKSDTLPAPTPIKEDNIPVIQNSELKKELTWTAYKGARKTGVSGTFKTIKLSHTKKGENLEEILQGAQFYCDGSSATTGSSSRDANIINYFFHKLTSPDISGSFNKFENNTISVTLKLNGKTVTKKFLYSKQGDEITINGSFDILKDFSAVEAFTNFHEACFRLHQGKTWTDVDFIIKISK